MKTGIIDFHTHAFPDQVAAQAIPFLEKEGEITAFHDGRITSLIASMDRAGVEKSVLCSIATRPAQFDSILAWSHRIRSERIIPLPSFHPADPDCLAQIHRIKDQGFPGVKLHPYYQDFYLDEERMLPIYDKLCRENLLVVMHTGYDIAFPRTRRATPAQIIKVVARFPDLKLVTTHLGGWDIWDEVAELMIGKPVYMDISYTLDFLDREKAKKMILDHPGEYVLFGTDSPWADQRAAVRQLKELELGAELEELILRGNAERLLRDS
ncbi:MAG: amidohydrolase family protein [Desulfobacterales bacterium]|nr:amidohydrolase family protein [Desulfobacterales bacterium]